MTIEKEKQGMELKDYESVLPDKNYAIRVGQEVPEGSVNLAYIHTPKVKPDENISLIDTTYTSDNVIPQDQLESLVAANEAGELEYVDLIGENEVATKPPGSTFPSDKVVVTNRFKKNELSVNSALYYKLELFYHYDSKTALPNSKGEYEVQKYTGQQIELTDENGNLLDETYKYDIYVQGQALNPNIYKVRIDLQRNTTEEETIMVRYNHIDEVVENDYVQSVRKSIELYVNKENTITVGSQSKHMLEGGKLRVINGTSSLDKKTEAEVLVARENDNDAEIFAVVPKDTGEGYKIIVPQKAGTDPRTPTIFAHRVVASYQKEDGTTIKRTVGHITDWCINPEALMDSEKPDYDGKWKNIGIPAGQAKMNAQEMLELSLPYNVASLPSDATYSIEDDKGNLLYNITSLTNNSSVDTVVNEVLSKMPQASAVGSKEEPWTSAMQVNSVIKNNPILHRCSIIAEQQKTEWDFKWKADGRGYTTKMLPFEGTYRTGVFVMTPNSGMYSGTHTFNYPNIDYWNRIGLTDEIAKWAWGFQSAIGLNAMVYQGDDPNLNIATGQSLMIRGGDTITSARALNNVELSFKVRVDDTVDDDVIGFAIRTSATGNGYLFAWEKDTRNTVSGSDRVVIDEYGVSTAKYTPEGQDTWNSTNNINTYINEKGLGTKHKRLFKMSVSSKAAASSPDIWDGVTRYPDDTSGKSFVDITSDGRYDGTGWVAGKEYKVTVISARYKTQIFINEDPNSTDKGTLVCEADDTQYLSGAYGPAVISQTLAYFYDFKINMKEYMEVKGETLKFSLIDTSKKQISNYTIDQIIGTAIEQALGTKEYEIIDYITTSDASVEITVDPVTKLIYAQLMDTSKLNTVRESWETKYNGMTVDGTGSVRYNADGTFTVNISPALLPTDQIPTNVQDFYWLNPVLVEGDNIGLSMQQPNKVVGYPTVPAKRLIGRVYTIPDDEIYKSDGIKSLESLFDSIYEKLDIPTDIPLKEVTLRIERGEVASIASNGTVVPRNAEYRVNYRFRLVKDGITRMPVDQYQDELGVNRIRLKDMLNSAGEIDSAIDADLVAWTPFENLEVVPLFAVKVEEERKIEIAKPLVEVSNEEYENWYIRVKKGKFTKRIILPYFDTGSSEKPPEIYVAYPQLLGMVSSPDQVVEVDLEYSIPEYTDQEFYNRPFTLIDKERPVILNEYTIQTRYAPIILKSKTELSYLEVYSIRSNQKRVLRVSDIDAAKGIIYLLDRVREQDDVYVRYAYGEDWFTYRGFYKDNNFFHLDLNPTPGHYHTIAKNGFHQWVPTDKDTETYIQDERENEELMVKQIHVYLRPTSIRTVDRSDVSIKASSIIAGTVATRTIYHTDEEWWFNPKDYKYDPTMLRLGKITLQANSRMEDNMTILDARTRGGGLDEKLSREVIERVNKESMYHWDIGYFDGEAYQENGVIIIRLPRTVLNTFTDAQVQQAVAKHKGYGILPIIEYYDELFAEDNLISNNEFNNGTHIGYYDPIRSSGTYDLLKMGNDHVLRLTDAAEYAITIPGYKVKEGQYRLDIRAMKEATAPERSNGLVELFYKDGTSKQIQLGNLSSNQWMVYREYIEVEENLHHLTITLNKSEQERTGNAIVDYVTFVPSPVIVEETTEIHEI